MVCFLKITKFKKNRKNRNERPRTRATHCILANGPIYQDSSEVDITQRIEYRRDYVSSESESLSNDKFDRLL